MASTHRIEHGYIALFLLILSSVYLPWYSNLFVGTSHKFSPPSIPHRPTVTKSEARLTCSIYNTHLLRQSNLWMQNKCYYCQSRSSCVPSWPGIPKQSSVRLPWTLPFRNTIPSAVYNILVMGRNLSHQRWLSLQRNDYLALVEVLWTSLHWCCDDAIIILVHYLVLATPVNHYMPASQLSAVGARVREQGKLCSGTTHGWVVDWQWAQRCPSWGWYYKCVREQDGWEK